MREHCCCPLVEARCRTCLAWKLKPPLQSGKYRGASPNVEASVPSRRNRGRCAPAVWVRETPLQGRQVCRDTRQTEDFGGQACCMCRTAGERRGQGLPLRPSASLLPPGQLRHFPWLLQRFRVRKPANPWPCVIPSQLTGLASAHSREAGLPPLLT